MNVTVETLAPCKKLIRIEIEAARVGETFDQTTKEFQKQASFPGFRPGKAPRDMVLKRYQKDIEEEVKRKLISDSYKQAVQDQKLSVVGSPDIEEIQFARDQNLQFAATVETAPEFQLPNYKGLVARKENKSVTDEDVEKALQLLRDRQASFRNVERAIQAGDYAVVSYQGSCEGKPISEWAPAARGLTEQKNFWVEVKPDSFIPGFGMQLVGAKVGEKRMVTVDFPADFVTPQVAGKQGVFEVEVNEVKERVMPEVNEEFAKSYGAESLERLREGIRTDLKNELEFTQTRGVRNQLVKGLLDGLQFDLPESVVMQETRNVVYNIVRENQNRGVTRESIEQQKEAIYNSASASAKDRVKAAFLFAKIADAEGIRVSEQEFGARVQHLASVYNVPIEKFVKELRQKDGFSEIHEQLIAEKVLDLLQKEARIEEVAAS